MSTEKSRSVDDAPFMDNERNIKIYDFEKAITAAGGFGRIQIYWLIIWFASISGANFFTFTLSYLELMPKFQWLEQGNFVSWDSKDICNGEIIKSQDQWRIDWSDSESLHNWMTDMELYWTSNFEIGLIGSLFFLGFAICGVLVKLLDNYGRKPILIAGAATNIVITIVLYFVNNLYVRYVFLFVYGVTWAKILTTYMYRQPRL